MTLSPNTASFRGTGVRTSTYLGDTVRHTTTPQAQSLLPSCGEKRKSPPCTRCLATPVCPSPGHILVRPPGHRGTCCLQGQPPTRSPRCCPRPLPGHSFHPGRQSPVLPPRVQHHGLWPRISCRSELLAASVCWTPLLLPIPLPGTVLASHHPVGSFAAMGVLLPNHHSIWGQVCATKMKGCGLAGTSPLRTLPSVTGAPGPAGGG